MIRLLIRQESIALFIWNPYPLQYLELKGYDTLIMSTEPVQNENILLVELDEDLVEAYEGYPLPRSLYAELITKTECSSRNYSTHARSRHSRQRKRFIIKQLDARSTNSTSISSISSNI